MRRAAKVDRNQGEVVAALRKAGATVQSLAAVGFGCPDLLVGFQGKTMLMEIKDGSRPPSARALTPDQIAWHLQWQGVPVAVVNDAKEALEELRRTTRPSCES